jgi:hypothetical protein
MNINDAYPSKYIKSADLQGRIIKLKIANVGYEQIGNDSKLIMYFQGKNKGMVLNRTNARTIADQYGDDTDNWTGADVEVFSMKVDMQGRMVDGLRVRVPPRQQAPAPRSAPAFAPNARQAQQPHPSQTPAMIDEHIAAGGDDPFDDNIPF